MEMYIKNVEKYFGNCQALNNVSFDIKPGEIVGLLGHNGAGKSTLIKCMMNALRSYSGCITIDEEDIRKHQELVAENCSFLLEPSFCEYLTAKENLKLLEKITTKRSQWSIDEILSMVSLKKASSKKVSEFSFGMKQRLGLAQILLSSARFIILDEPTVGLDPLGIDIIKKLILKLSEAGCAVLFSSHQINDVLDICTRVIVMNEGKIVYDDKIKNLVRKKYNIIYDKPIEMTDYLRKIASSVVVNNTTICFEKVDFIAPVMQYMSQSGFSIVDIDTENNLEYLKTYMAEGANKL